MLFTSVTALARTENVSYIDENGETQTVNANVIDRQFTTLGTNGSTTWYIVQNGGIDFSKFQITINGDVRLILRDRTTMTVTFDTPGSAIFLDGSLTIYGQSQGSGKLDVHSEYTNAIFSKGNNCNLTINGGNVSISSERDNGVRLSWGGFTVNGGSVSVTTNQGNDAVICHDATINGGTVNATAASYGL